MNFVKMKAEEGSFFTSEEILNAAMEATSNLLPTKSKERYEKTYASFCEWRTKKTVTGADENVMLAFFLKR